MLLINIHKFQVILAQPVTLAALKNKVQNIRRVLCLESENILVLSSTQDLRKGCEIDTKRNVTIAPVRREAFGLEHHRNESNM